MEIKPVLPGEISCRNCKHFNYTNLCWEYVKNEPACKKFLSKEGAKNTEQLIEVDNGNTIAT